MKLGFKCIAKVGLASFSNMEIGFWAEAEEEEIEGLDRKEKANYIRDLVKELTIEALAQDGLDHRWNNIIIETINLYKENDRRLPPYPAPERR